ncbi:MAG TPA: FISUMP domain-containing protein [Bacteroidia bacterium]|nr:FISUMP domain-containing protein [Bacteroidia bacterium]
MKDQSTTTAGTITMTVVNAASPTDQIATIYVGTAAVLTVTLNNQTGSDIALTSTSNLEIFMPSFCSTTAQLNAMVITEISQAAWTPAASSPGAVSLQLNSTAGTWPSGQTLSFNITNVLSTESPDSDSVQVNFNLTGTSVPSQDVVTVVLSTPVVHTNVNLDSVLELETEYDGVVYVSTSGSDLTNSLFLNIKNKSSNPFYNGAAMWQGNPKVIVSFVYGDTAGALAPADKSAAGTTGSAWAISAAVADDETGGWQISNPSATGDNNSPRWVLSPGSTNQGIIGIGADANVTFVFSTIFSFTPVGATQMYVQFSGFMQDENTKYNDQVFVLPVLKCAALAEGAAKMYGPAKIDIREKQDVDVKLFWAALYIASISLDSDAQIDALALPYVATYPDTDTMVYDNFQVTMPQLSPGDRITFTLNVMDGNGATLSEPQFKVSIMQKPGIYSFTGPASVNFNLNQFATVALNWKVYEAGKVEITSDHSATYTATYSNTALWTTDDKTITLNALTDTTEVTFTLNAYNIHGALVDTSSVTVNVIRVGWCDPKDQTVYTLVTINNQVWIGQDYNYDDAGTWPTTSSPPSTLPNSLYLNNDGEPVYGRLYVYPSAVSNIPAGWKLPSIVDWGNLLAYVNNSPQALLSEGSSGLNLEPGGMVLTLTGPSGQGEFGMYWGVPVNATDEASMLISNSACDTLEVPPNPMGSGTPYYSVRYLMDS